jgi:hypothetical protein
VLAVPAPGRSGGTLERGWGRRSGRRRGLLVAAQQHQRGDHERGGGNCADELPGAAIGVVQPVGKLRTRNPGGTVDELRPGDRHPVGEIGERRRADRGGVVCSDRDRRRRALLARGLLDPCRLVMSAAAVADDPAQGARRQLRRDPHRGDGSAFLMPGEDLAHGEARRRIRKAAIATW